MSGKLTDKQQRFVEEYVVDCNATEAAKRAGYSERSASDIGRQLLGKTPVKSAVEALLLARKSDAERRASEASLSREWVLERLQLEAQDCGETGSHSARVRALELLGRHLGLFAEAPAGASVNVNVNVATAVDLSKLTDEQLEQLERLRASVAPAVAGGAGVAA